MKRAGFIALAFALIATSARSDGIGNNWVGADTFGGIPQFKAPAPPPPCIPGNNGQLDFSVCSNIVYVPALIH